MATAARTTTTSSSSSSSSCSYRISSEDLESLSSILIRPLSDENARIVDEYGEAVCLSRRLRERHQLPERMAFPGQFDLDSALRSSQRSMVGADAARRAFDAAAICVVKAVAQQQQQQQEENEDDDDDDDEEGDKTGNWNKILRDIGKVRDASVDATLRYEKWLSRPNKKRRLAPNEDANKQTQKKAKTTDSLAQSSDAAVASSASTSESKKKVPSSLSTTPMVSAPSPSPGSIDSRATVSRAILCAAASVAFAELTPNFDTNLDRGHLASLNGGAIDPLQVPQNVQHQPDDSTNNTTANTAPTIAINMGAVMVQAKTFGGRAISSALGASRRGDRRRRWRIDVYQQAEQERRRQFQRNLPQPSIIDKHTIRSLPLALSAITNPFGPEGALSIVHPDSSGDEEEHDYDQHAPATNQIEDARTLRWTRDCLPRLLTILQHGPGHALWVDLDWSGRAGRVADMLNAYVMPQYHHDAQSSSPTNNISSWTKKNTHHYLNYGPHLIVTNARDFPKFVRCFAHGGLATHHNQHLHRPDHPMSSSTPRPTTQLRALRYVGPSKRRRCLRRHFANAHYSLSGTSDAPYHVVLTTYQIFCLDYVHLCHIPFQVVFLDDGMSWLGAAHSDPNGKLGRVWDAGVWSKSDNHAGLAGVSGSTTAIASASTHGASPAGGGPGTATSSGTGIGGSGHASLGTEDDWDFDYLMTSPKSKKNRAMSILATRTVSSSETEDSSDEDDDDDDDETNEASRAAKRGYGTNLLIGLTARHRILLAPRTHAVYRDAVHPAPVPALLSFIIPQFSDVVREEWDRSRIHNCSASMNHVRSLLCRSVVVHAPTLTPSHSLSSFSDGDHHQDEEDIPLSDLAMMALSGTTIPTASTAVDESDDAASDQGADEYGSSSRTPSTTITNDDLVSSGKIVQSRRHAASWLRDLSALRMELGSAPLDPILDAMRARASSGHVCEEVVTASSVTSSGAGGAVSGPSAYRLAVRCGRTFGSEQGLRQHMAALHAPPGTWLCRSCGQDCGTSQARTHHERYCGTTTPGGTPGSGGQGSSGGGIPTVGQGIGSSQGSKLHHGPSGTVGKKGGGGSSQGGGSGAGGGADDNKDKDGSFRLPGYRGVWVNPSGKHFVKIKGKPLLDGDVDGKPGDNGDGRLQVFASPDDAAHKHDDVVKGRGDARTAELNFKPNGTRIVYEDSAAAAAAGRGLEMLGGGASSVVPALSVINIKDLPKDVKPLLRDPRQTSRTGGNSKRYVYAYRGVCRQARKGHDRWQSQISFGGTNHYLGTFDSEWDAAAIYAWAHLILYGEEATKKAQREGEEAAAAYEQEKKDIAAGKIVAPPPKPKKKKPAPKKTTKGAAGSTKQQKDGDTSGSKDGSNNVDGGDDDNNNKPKKKRAASKQQDSNGGGVKNPLVDDETLAKFVKKAPSLGFQELLSSKNDDTLLRECATRIAALYNNPSSTTSPPQGIPPPLCIPLNNMSTQSTQGCAILCGLNATDFCWEVNFFPSRFQGGLEDAAFASSSALESEYGINGFNSSFRTLITSSPCILGRASLGLETAFSNCLSNNNNTTPPMIGGPIGNIDCHVGGTVGSCSEQSAWIRFSPTSASEFQIAACNDEDVVTLNGNRITASMGPFPLHSEDICSVGARVFVFVLPPKTE